MIDVKSKKLTTIAITTRAAALAKRERDLQRKKGFAASITSIASEILINALDKK